jgi:hypothetical protein
MVQVCFWLIVLLSGIYIAGPIGDPDLWWHIVIGEWILQNKTVPYVDYWNRFSAGKPWLAYSWSQEILYALANRLDPINGLVSLQLLYGAGVSLVFTLVCYYLIRGCSAKSSNYAHPHGAALLLSVGATFGMAQHFHIRPQTITWLTAAVMVALLELIRRFGWSWYKVILICLSVIIWSNTHITAIFIPFIAGTWLLVSGILSHKERLIIFSLICLALLCTPYGGAHLVLATQKSSHPFIYSSIIEFGPATIREPATGILLIFSVLLALGLIRADESLMPYPLSIICGLFVLAGLTVVKFLPFAIVLEMVLIASLWGSTSGKAFGGVAEGITRLSKLLSGLAGVGAGFLLLALIIVRGHQLFANPLVNERIPAASIDFIQNEKFPLKLANSFGDGGYLLYRFMKSPNFRVVIDGRTNVNNVKVTELYYEALYGNSNWRSYLSIIQPEVILWRNGSPLVALLLEAPEWCRVFKEGNNSKGFSVFMPNKSLPTYPHLVSDDCI